MLIVVRSYSEPVLYGDPRLERNIAGLVIRFTGFNHLYNCSTILSAATVCCCSGDWC